MSWKWANYRYCYIQPGLKKFNQCSSRTYFNPVVDELWMLDFGLMYDSDREMY